MTKQSDQSEEYLFNVFDHYGKMCYWGMDEATCLCCGIDPMNYYLDGEDGSIPVPEDIKYKILHLRELARRAISAKTLKPIRSYRGPNGPPTHNLNPLEFINWATLKGFPPPAELKRVVFCHSAYAEESDQGETGKPIRTSTLHRERCRALAQYLWELHPEWTIAAMLQSEEIKIYGCKGKTYDEKTLRNWIKDLAPDNSPGRRPNKAKKSPPL